MHTRAVPVMHWHFEQSAMAALACSCWHHGVTRVGGQWSAGDTHPHRLSAGPALAQITKSSDVGGRMVHVAAIDVAKSRAMCTTTSWPTCTAAAPAAAAARGIMMRSAIATRYL